MENENRVVDTTPVQIQEQQKRGLGRIVAAGAVVAASLVGFNVLSNDGDGSPRVEGSPSGSSDETPNNELEDMLTVNSSRFNCVDDNDGTAEIIEIDEYHIVRPNLVSTLRVDASVHTQDNRLFSDSPANPIINLETAETALLEFQNTLCESPEMTAMTANYFANLEVEGVKVLDLNDWLQGYEGSADVINDNAAEFIPQYFDDNVSFEDQLAANQDHRNIAENLAELLSRFENLGIVEADTTFNYHLSAGGLSTGIPEFAVNDEQYTGKFIQLQLTFKDGRCVKALMVNIDDQRIAESDLCVVSIPPTMPPMVFETTTTNPETPPTTGTTPPTTGVTTTTGPNGSTTTSVPSKASVPTTQAPPAITSPSARPSTTLAQPPATAAPDTLPQGVTPTTWDVVPTPSTIQHPDAPPVTGTAPATTQPPATTPTAPPASGTVGTR
jgi:hypothetical protein